MRIVGWCDDEFGLDDGNDMDNATSDRDSETINPETSGNRDAALRKFRARYPLFLPGGLGRRRLAAR